MFSSVQAHMGGYERRETRVREAYLLRHLVQAEKFIDTSVEIFHLLKCEVQGFGTSSDLIHDIAGPPRESQEEQIERQGKEEKKGKREGW